MKRSHSVKPDIELAIKAKAGEVIQKVVPVWKQLNLLTRAIELLNARGQRPLTVEEQAEMDASQVAWDYIKAVRSHSSTLQAEVDQGSSIDVDGRWP